MPSSTAFSKHPQEIKHVARSEMSPRPDGFIRVTTVAILMILQCSQYCSTSLQTAVRVNSQCLTKTTTNMVSFQAVTGLLI